MLRAAQTVPSGLHPMSEFQRGSVRLPVLGVLLVGACVAIYVGLFPKPPASAPTLSSSGSVSAPGLNFAPTAASDKTAPAAGRRTVSGRVVQTSEYCGGAAPTEEMLESLRKEKPFPHKELFIRAGTLNKYSRPIVQKFTSDAEGSFKIALPPGDYCVVDASKKDELKIPATAKGNPKEGESRAACLQKWYRACDKTLTVGKQNLKGVVIKFHHPCNPPCSTGGPPPV